MSVESRSSARVSLLEHFTSSLTAGNRVGRFIIHVVVPLLAGDSPPKVVELIPGKFAIRTPLDDGSLDRDFLVATNHNRKLSLPVTCKRYADAIAFGKEKFGLIGVQDIWSLLDLVKRNDTMQSMVYLPSTGEFHLSARLGKDGQMGPVEKTFIKDLLQKATASLATRSD